MLCRRNASHDRLSRVFIPSCDIAFELCDNKQVLPLDENTFERRSWPPSIPVKPEKLAEAGFYYTGSLR